MINIKSVKQLKELDTCEPYICINYDEVLPLYMSDRNYTTKDKIIQIKVALEITYDNKPNYRLSLIHHEINQTILVYIIHPCVTFYRVTCYGTEWHFKIFRKKFEASSQ